jgi:hypothetical protein
MTRLPRPLAGFDAARLRVMERRDVRSGTGAAFALAPLLIAVSMAALGPVVPGYAALSFAALVVLGALGIAWRCGGRRRPHPIALAGGATLVVLGGTAMQLGVEMGWTVMGLIAVLVIGCAAFLPWSGRWHLTLLAMFGVVYLIGLVLDRAASDDQRAAWVLVGLAAFATSAVGNRLVVRRRLQRWRVESQVRRDGAELRTLIASLRAARERISSLEEILSICSYCKRIREGTTWLPLGLVVGNRSAAELRSSMCPDCAAAGTARADR